MSSIILFQQGDKCFDPKSGLFYDPWKSHIFDTLDQIRLWNRDISIYFIADKIETDTLCELKKRNVIYIDGNLKLDRDISFLLNYCPNETNPLWKTSLGRFFYIEQVIKDYDLNGVFTFDNDVLVYCNLDEIENKMCKHYENNAITRVDQNALICGMMWLKNKHSIKLLNDALIEMVKIPQNLHLNECALLGECWKKYGNFLIDMLPIWFEGQYSDKCDDIGGFFDPATIGQFFGGCQNGSPKGHIMMHHELGPRLHKMIQTESHVILKNKDDMNRSYFSFKELKNSEKEYKLYSIHVHTKKMKEFMSNV